MSEETAAVAAVPNTDVPVAVDPALLNKPTRPEATAESGSAENSELLKHKLGLANNHAKQAKKDADEARDALQKVQEQLAEIKNQQQATVQKSLQDQGQYKELWEQTKRTVGERDAEIVQLKAELSSVKQDRQQDRLRAAALSQINTAGALNSQQLFTLLQSGLRQNDEGSPVMLNGGVEQPLGEYLANLKQSSEWQHHFAASGQTGMSRVGGGTTVAPGRDNPYRSGNMTEALRLEVENPDLARALKKEAQAARSSQ